MKGQKFCGQVLSLLFASTALSFGQSSSVSVANGGWKGAPANSSAASFEPVGPGTINYIEGQVSLDSQPLTLQSVGRARLNPGQVLNTGNGYVEVLLTPGAFLRIGNGSEIRMVSAGLANTTAQLVHGTAVLEVDQMIKGTTLSVLMDRTTARIEKNGLYDFNAGGQAVMVLNGKAKIQEPGGTQTLGRHDEVLLGSDRPLKKRGFNEKAVKEEPLYVWSKVRSEDEAQASAGAARNADAYAVAGSGWFWDPTWASYGFWPAAGALYSPFGYGFYSPAFFGLGYYGGGYGYYGGGGYYGGRHYGHPGWHGHDHDGDHHWAGGRVNNGWHGRVGGIGAARASGFRSGGFAHPTGGFHGGSAGFHGGGGGFHGGGGRR